MEHYNMDLTLKVWKQKNSDAKGSFENFQVKNISSEMSFLEMFDVLNEQLIAEGKEPIAFDHDCRDKECRDGRSCHKQRTSGTPESYILRKGDTGKYLQASGIYRNYELWNSDARLRPACELKELSGRFGYYRTRTR